MSARDKYTTFVKSAKGYRKGVHKVPKFTRVPHLAGESKGVLTICWQHTCPTQICLVLRYIISPNLQTSKNFKKSSSPGSTCSVDYENCPNTTISQP
ncbi:L31 domain-containing protein [Rhizoctonia solani AG-1 IA]|uniref:L31 domain-containing protein n=1 Tax=Thanatephorus cucumeris (strain AG1-IA) TaxID=983506 RepID=L8X3E7_THACA|nr:L31 domain-containing protein [Rhizoctonia solani AG-1 IA]